MLRITARLSRIARATQLGAGPLDYTHAGGALTIMPRPASGFVPVVKLEGTGIA